MVCVRSKIGKTTDNTRRQNKIFEKELRKMKVGGLGNITSDTANGAPNRDSLWLEKNLSRDDKTTPKGKKTKEARFSPK
ncbi:hypothetical protein AMTR_s00074p00077070 [Amborella trichopoda]|uniref:Uncharacterized protein n=1 Tax=Amborella trichopoda TaxID=13333 RepID=W1NM06_AMBTC|nr:hypothetical protein AMTR_s00074p00077070 [Amborella trichopoda]